MKPFVPVVLTTTLLIATSPAVAGGRAEFLRGPDGFSVEILIDDVPGARSLALGPGGTLFVGTMTGGKVYAVRDALGPNPKTTVVASDLRMPNGVAIHEGSLYVAEPGRILRFADAEAGATSEWRYTVVTDGLPVAPKPIHAWRYIGFAPTGELYVALGAPCNVCVAPEHDVILRMTADGRDAEVFARGVRNSVGFDWHPDTGELWFTDNGRDMLGDELPPDELNRAARAGLDFGFPYCHAGVIPDPEFGKAGECAASEAPVQALDPHVAALGMRFYTGSMFPAEYRGQIFIAEHGSWNRSKQAGKTGYRVTLVRLDGNRATAYEPFIEGWLDGQEILGRPVDLLVAPDGALLISDDRRGVVYRVGYSGAD